MNDSKYCELEDFKKDYKNVHGQISLTICVFGSIANIINISVLRNKQMQSSTNCILTGLAFSDLLVMLQYIPFAIHRHYKSLVSTKIIAAVHFSYNWAVFYKFHALFTIVLHFISCCLTIILAIWRYIYVSKIHANNLFSNHRKTNIVVAFTYLICPLICIPLFSTLEIKTTEQRVTLEGIMVENTDTDKYPNSSFTYHTIYILHPNDPHHLSIWVYSLCLKFIPCIFLSVLSYLIIKKLLDTKKRRIKLLNSCNPLQSLTGKSKINTFQLYKENQADRTTNMLLVVLLLFLITEFPQAILGQMSAIYGEEFLDQCYSALGDFFDMLALLNSSINFILYCTMSRQFRKTFQEMFSIKDIRCWFEPIQKQPEETAVETKMSLV